MSFLKKPFLKLKESAAEARAEAFQKVAAASESGPSSPTLSSPTSTGANTPNSDKRRSREVINAERFRRSLDKERTRAEHRKRESLARIEDERFLQEGPPELTKLYRPYSMNMSKSWNQEDRVLFKDLDWNNINGEMITFRARIHTLRRMSAKLVFIVFRQQTITIQGVLQHISDNVEDENKGTISEQMVRSVEHYPSETIVVGHAKIRKAPKRVNNATIHDYELEVYEVHKLINLTENVPFTVYDAENINRDKEDVDEEQEDSGTLPSGTSPINSPIDTPRESTDLSILRRDIAPSQDKLLSRTSVDTMKRERSLPQRARLNNRIVDLRTAPSQSIFRIQSGICNIFRSYLDERGFIEIHTPKLQGGASESGSTVFEVNYFGRSAFLAQSPQLYKQMSIAADFERVYEIGPVFRAEDSNTPRHLTEYTGLDIEMALEEHYHEALEVIDGMFKNLWENIYKRYQKEIEIISQFYPHEKVEWLEVTPRIPFAEGIQMLVDDGWIEEDGKPPSPLEDLSTRAEIHLGALVKAKYQTDYYILDKFPSSVRPFYAMPDPTDDRYTNSFDIFMRGQEILTGGQRIHDATFLEQRMKKKGMRPETMTEYLEGFRWGAPPHAGCGIGLERLTYLFLNLGNIRLASLFHRDPKSLPATAPTLVLRHEEASTLTPPWDKKDAILDESKPREFQPLEKLIANYGDAGNTSWLDERYKVWRHQSTGAAQGYVIYHHHVIAVCEPLCHKSQYTTVVSAFLQYVKDTYKDSKPIWMIIGKDLETYLGEKFLWRSVGCIAEERVDPRNNQAIKDDTLGKKVRHAEKEGVKLVSLPANEPVPEDVVTKIDAGVREWQQGRKGAQVHLTEILPWVDQEHRRYYYATSADGNTVHALVVLHQLSPTNGYQVKFSLEFPGAPNGTSESLILYSLKSIAAADPEAKQVTFGTGAMPTLEAGHNVGKNKARALKKTYEAIVKQFKLTNKSEFREKMGAWNDPAFVAYPRGGLGASGIRAIMSFLEDESSNGNNN